LKPTLVEYVVDPEGYIWQKGRIVWDLPQPTDKKQRAALVSSVNPEIREAYTDVDALRAFLRAHFTACGWRHQFFTGADFYAEK
jgi:hypothetical protein